MLNLSHPPHRQASTADVDEIQTRNCSVGLRIYTEEDPRTRIGSSPSTSRAYWIRPFGCRTWDAGYIIILL
ncbi:hypothetical protein DTO169C6_2397 [Paecilomyces variotii]|nr:hypothetical protein DTO169C6_2397 [Paecilomyces variotii]